MIEPRLELRTLSIRDEGCFSEMWWDGTKFAVSVERTFDDERPAINADGEYLCVATRFIRGGYDTFEVMVAGHSRILFHKGNTELDSIGCVVVGDRFGRIGDKTAVLDSKKAFERFVTLTAGLKQFTMKVSGRQSQEVK